MTGLDEQRLAVAREICREMYSIGADEQRVVRSLAKLWADSIDQVDFEENHRLWNSFTEFARANLHRAKKEAMKPYDSIDTYINFNS